MTTDDLDRVLDKMERKIITTSSLYKALEYPPSAIMHNLHRDVKKYINYTKYLKMKDKDQDLIYEGYHKNRVRSNKIAYICEDFEDNIGNPFGNKDSDDSDDKTDDKSDSDSGDTKSKDTAPKSKPKSTSKPKDKPKDGKLSEEELDEELDILATKKSKIQKLFDSESIDKDVAHAALDKLKSLTNDLVAKYI